MGWDLPFSEPENCPAFWAHERYDGMKSRTMQENYEVIKCAENSIPTSNVIPVPHSAMK